MSETLRQVLQRGPAQRFADVPSEAFHGAGIRQGRSAAAGRVLQDVSPLTNALRSVGGTLAQGGAQLGTREARAAGDLTNVGLRYLAERGDKSAVKKALPAYDQRVLDKTRQRMVFEVPAAQRYRQFAGDVGAALRNTRGAVPLVAGGAVALGAGSAALARRGDSEEPRSHGRGAAIGGAILGVSALAGLIAGRSAGAARAAREVARRQGLQYKKPSLGVRLMDRIHGHRAGDSRSVGRLRKNMFHAAATAPNARLLAETPRRGAQVGAALGAAAGVPLAGLGYLAGS